MKTTIILQTLQHYNHQNIVNYALYVQHNHIRNITQVTLVSGRQKQRKFTKASPLWAGLNYRCGLSAKQSVQGNGELETLAAPELGQS